MKRIKVLLLACMLTLIMCIPTYAGQWLKDDTGWWYENSNGSYLKSGWYWIDGKSYLFNDSGYILVNTRTPDGYNVNNNGAWTINGVEQFRDTKAVISGFDVVIPNGYDSDVDTINNSISLTETNGDAGVLLMTVHEDGIQKIKEGFGEEGLKRLSDEVAGGLISEVGSNPVLLNQDLKQYTNGLWNHYLYNVVSADNNTITCNMYINLLDNDARIVIMINNNREFTEDQFMMYHVK